MIELSLFLSDVLLAKGMDKQTADHKTLMKQLDEVKEAIQNRESGDPLREKFKIFAGKIQCLNVKYKMILRHFTKITWRITWQKKKHFGRLSSKRKGKQT